ncbi:hypothetical protein NEFER03_0424 [Nematocida sp. LUAm3]|nr:hypothetical protein NEFER03_0424 [Nematocida sp. LUAm3]KAI5175882.1 hypothetical protein NEFER02_1742 [Nematocida sp. LUAm2]KAI5178736.1 hypothetical protein NEFER01_1855 [Nematocida sp. LUAm1]
MPSCLEYVGNRVLYGEWSGTLIELTENSSVMHMDAPITSILSDGSREYVGTVGGEVWRIMGEEKTLLFKGKDKYYKEVSTNMVISIFSYKKIIIVVFLKGNIFLHRTDRESEFPAVEVINEEKEIECACMKDEKIFYLVGGKEIKIYSVEKRKQVGYTNVLDFEITKITVINEKNLEILIYGTTCGKVCVTHLHDGSSYLFKAHKKQVENEEVFYPVTMLGEVSDRVIVTGGADGKVITWDIRERNRIRTIYATDKIIVNGCIKVRNERVEEITIAVSPRIEDIYSSNPEDKVDLIRHVVDN